MVNLNFKSLTEAKALLENLRGQSLTATEGWTPSHVFRHCRQSIDCSMMGYPQRRSPLFRATVGKIAAGIFLRSGRFSHGLTDDIPGCPPIVDNGNADEALTELLASIAAFDRTHPADLTPHFAFGKLKKANYGLIHALHIADHLQLIQSNR